MDDEKEPAVGTKSHALGQGDHPRERAQDGPADGHARGAAHRGLRGARRARGGRRGTVAFVAEGEAVRALHHELAEREVAHEGVDHPESANGPGSAAKNERSRKARSKDLSRFSKISKP